MINTLTTMMGERVQVSSQFYFSFFIISENSKEEFAKSHHIHSKEDKQAYYILAC